jgi:hypothetical protein
VSTRIQGAATTLCRISGRKSETTGVFLKHAGVFPKTYRSFSKNMREYFQKHAEVFSKRCGSFSKKIREFF